MIIKSESTVCKATACLIAFGFFFVMHTYINNAHIRTLFIYFQINIFSLSELNRLSQKLPFWDKYENIELKYTCHHVQKSLCQLRTVYLVFICMSIWINFYNRDIYGFALI